MGNFTLYYLTECSFTFLLYYIVLYAFCLVTIFSFWHNELLIQFCLIYVLCCTIAETNFGVYFLTLIVRKFRLNAFLLLYRLLNKLRITYTIELQSNCCLIWFLICETLCKLAISNLRLKNIR